MKLIEKLYNHKNTTGKVVMASALLLAPFIAGIAGPSWVLEVENLAPKTLAEARGMAVLSLFAIVIFVFLSFFNKPRKFFYGAILVSWGFIWSGFLAELAAGDIASILSSIIFFWFVYILPFIFLFILFSGVVMRETSNFKTFVRAYRIATISWVIIPVLFSVFIFSFTFLFGLGHV